jgi:hypothetical protein
MVQLCDYNYNEGPVADTFRILWGLMKISSAAALMSFVFVHVTPVFATDPTDRRLIDDVAVAKATISLLQSRDFAAVRERFDPAIGPLQDDVLAGMANMVTGETKSIETISSKGNFSLGPGNSESQTILEYQIGSRWVVANIVIKTENNIKRVSGLYFSVNNQPLRDSSALSGKGFVQYAFLAGWIGIIGLTGYAMVLAFRRHSGWRRWALMTAMPAGFGPAVAMNWNNAAFWIFGGSVSRGAATFYPILSARFPMAWFGMFGGTEFHTPYLYISAPLIAIGYLIWRISIWQRPVEQPSEGAQRVGLD